MMEPRTLAELMEQDPLAPLQTAIVATVTTLNPGLNVLAHPGKVDLSELVAKTVVKAPGVGIGWSRIREAQMAEGHFCLTVDWVGYIVCEATLATGRRVEKEAVGLAIGARLLAMLCDEETCLWGKTAVLPPETTPAPEFKPLFTVRDQSQGMAYYTVTWTQIVVDLGQSVFPAHAGHYDETGVIIYSDPADIDALAPWLPAPEVPDNA